MLVVGGYGEDGSAIGAAELYDPRAETWEPAESLAQARGKHASIRLRDGRVLVLGGAPDSETRARLRSTELFDPATKRFVPGPLLRVGRYKLVERRHDAGRRQGGRRRRRSRRRAREREGGRGAAGDRPPPLAERLRTATRTAQGALLVGGYDERIAIRPEAYLVRP